MDERTQKQELKHIIEHSDPREIDRDFMDKLLQEIKIKRAILPEEVARMILFLADFPDREWNLAEIVGSMKSNLEEINWRDVYSCFLDVNFNIWTLESLYLIIDCWVYISGIITVPYEIFFKRWKNERAQIYFLRLIIESDERRTQLYSNVFFNRIITLEESRNHRFKSPMTYESNFNCVELFQCIRMLESTPLIELIAKKSPEWCTVGLGFIQPTFSKVFEELLMSFAKGASNSFVFYVLFKNQPELMLQKACFLVKAAISISKVLDILLEQKMLPLVSELLEPAEFCLDIIVLSSVRDHLNLNIWLSNSLTSKRDAFARSLISYLNSKVCRDAEKMFPLSVGVLSVFTTTIEQFLRTLRPETAAMYNEFKSNIPSGLKMQKNKDLRVEEEASNFISQIINSHRGIEGSISQIREFLAGDVFSRELASKIFSALLENYGSLYKLPNSDLVALFYGGLIKEGVLPRTHMKIAVEYVKGSLMYPENEREYSFGFKCLEVFLPSHPSFLSEIEEIETVKNSLIKSELILVDPVSHPVLGLGDIMRLQFKEEIGAEDERKIAEIFESQGPLLLDDRVIVDLSGILMQSDISHDRVLQYIMRNLVSGNNAVFASVVLSLGGDFFSHFVDEVLGFLRILLDHRSRDEIRFCKNLGVTLGLVTLAKNRVITLERFDFKKFVIKFVECRRILFGVTFISNFLKQGNLGLVFKPNNPWLTKIMGILEELHSCTLKPVRREIEMLFDHFSLTLSSRPLRSFTFKSKEYLAEYMIEDKDPITRHVISLALDLSVREISPPIVKKACAVAMQTGMVLFKYMVIEKGTEYVLFRNMVMNLMKSLCFISAQEPIKACISGNVSYFMKLCSLEFSTEQVYKVAMQNQDICCRLIQKAGMSRVNESISSCYDTLMFTTGKSRNIKSVLLESPEHVERINIKAIESGEYQEIKTHLIQLGRKVPCQIRNFVDEEWRGLLGDDREQAFKKILDSIEGSEEKDEECIRLCKYITGHLIKTGSKEGFLFECMEKIFKTSFKTQKEVLGWLIYSNDPRKFSVNLVSKFVEYSLINVAEYDQALSKMPMTEDNLEFIITLLTTLITTEVQICTVYDFICTLEMLAGHSDDNRVFDFFQKISGLMMHIEGTGASEYDEYVRNCRFTTVPEVFLPEFMMRVDYPSSLNIKAAFKVSWDHFIRHHKVPTAYCYLKIDPLPSLIKDRPFEPLKESLAVFLEAYRKRNYLFFKLYTRFIVKLLDVLEDTPKNRSLVYSLLEVLFPSKVPGFVSSFLEILNHRFVSKYFDSEDGVIIAIEVLRCSIHNQKLMYPVTRVILSFRRYPVYIRMYSSYLSYCCPQEYPHLKNFINCFRDKLVPVENQNSFFRLRTALQNRSPIRVTDLGIGKNLWLYLIDNLNDMNAISSTVIESIKFMIERKMYSEEIITVLWIRMKAGDAPEALVACYNEISSIEAYRGFLKSLENRTYNKL